MTSTLGTFLQASRNRIRPDQAGIPDGDRRRVPGLRREEVALLAGVSVDYYVRLEQGRETSPSPAVADALGRALMLDEHAVAHLYRLAGLTPRRTVATTETVDPDLLALLDEWETHPAIVLGHAFDVLATNRLGEALFLGFPGTRNLIESLFLDPVARTLYRDWPEVARNTVAGFRILDAAQPDDPRISAVRGRLSSGSAEFRDLWQDNLVRGTRMRAKRFQHPAAGDFSLVIQTFDVRSAPGQELVVYRAEAGSPAVDALPLLRSWRAPDLTAVLRE